MTWRAQKGKRDNITERFRSFSQFVPRITLKSCFFSSRGSIYRFSTERLHTLVPEDFLFSQIPHAEKNQEKVKIKENHWHQGLDIERVAFLFSSVWMVFKYLEQALYGLVKNRKNIVFKLKYPARRIVFFSNLSLVCILTIFLKFRKFQLQNLYKIYLSENIVLWKRVYFSYLLVRD